MFVISFVFRIFHIHRDFEIVGYAKQIIFLDLLQKTQENIWKTDLSWIFVTLMLRWLQINPKQQLENLSKLKIYEYHYSEDFADSVGIPEYSRKDTGVIAQEVRDVLPDAVRETGDVPLPNGEVIENLLVVDKVKRYFTWLFFLKFLQIITMKIKCLPEYCCSAMLF